VRFAIEIKREAGKYFLKPVQYLQIKLLNLCTLHRYIDVNGLLYETCETITLKTYGALFIARRNNAP
jgi:hypothetical protein